MIPITPTIALDDAEIEERFIRSSGPGGQNVNKVSTAVQLRFDVAGSPNLPGWVKHRLSVLAGSRLTGEGVLVLTAQSQRTQEANRREAVERLVALIQAACHRDKPRRPTRPTKGSQTRRMDGKTLRGAIKKGRQSKPSLD
ncbi:alternative ribosome rescue aminoacyl-tRNA hydrolase ArfB [Rhodospirillum rubrum]|uniref:Class I peptide chain release factor n=1 Tax=Rhodospirillum rubrum (strain ATCC 11170 / ATH 1.1.1 / DSM 467 / LMG 4362 / NCIMB 8255 / S1) TaxID=269796 RepID=Q2RY93_RHORT|nr:alternative ribosome rescue aminoacyl-tRNA hydrolase ArfB [Rhodospirillum rubrum]ABC20902.1 Class I peptide chain release factor [Rhodospirillum rubrum ATCC 11170]AEO46569.1 class I peptide chain release factor [Rhodospirillum rubrum F11]MBK5952460.1 aminoacyl-tRNA hydrolase [Rhodospirillum rubrum]QXG80602.1 aminoacyl-tRNA hydrolase [Rhodospirillum rubrum]HAP99965.1 aminoacyl-tRNA hydrolase [Rhodospirillum rubrum]